MAVRARTRYALHEGGTKYYRVIELRDEGSSARNLVIFNYGKTGTNGQVDIDVASSLTADRKVRDKEKRGYSFTEDSGYVTHTDDLPMFILAHPDVSRWLGGLTTIVTAEDVIAARAEPAPAQIDRTHIADWGTW